MKQLFVVLSLVLSVACASSRNDVETTPAAAPAATATTTATSSETVTTTSAPAPAAESVPAAAASAQADIVPQASTPPPLSRELQKNMPKAKFTRKLLIGSEDAMRRGEPVDHAKGEILLTPLCPIPVRTEEPCKGRTPDATGFCRTEEGGYVVFGDLIKMRLKQGHRLVKYSWKDGRAFAWIETPSGTKEVPIEGFWAYLDPNPMTTRFYCCDQITWIEVLWLQYLRPFDPNTLTTIASRVTDLEVDMSNVKTGLANAQGDITKLKELSVATLPATNVTDTSAEGVALVEGGEGPRSVKILYAPTETRLQEAIRSGNFSPAEAGGLLVFGPQDAGTAGPHQQQVKVAMFGDLDDGYMVAVAKDSATGTVEFGKVIQFEGQEPWVFPCFRGLWQGAGCTVALLAGTELTGITNLFSNEESNNDDDHGHPGPEPPPGASFGSLSVNVTKLVGAIRGTPQRIGSESIPPPQAVPDLAATRIDADAPVDLSSLRRPLYRQYTPQPIDSMRPPRTQVSLVGRYSPDGEWYAGVRIIINNN